MKAKSVLLFILFSASLSQVHSQQERSWSPIWIDVGMRLRSNPEPPISDIRQEKTSGQYTGIFRDLGVHASINFSVLSFYGQVFLTGQIIPENNRYSYEQVIIGIAAGQRYSKRFIMAAVFAGPSLNYEHEFSLHPKRPVYAGFHFNQQIFFKPIPEIGLGIELMQNVNAYKSFAAYQFTVMFGNGY